MVGARIRAVNAALGLALGTRAVVWALLAALLAVILDFLPLFNLLGYDFSFALGLLAAVASVDIGCGVVAAARRQGSGADVTRLALKGIGLSCVTLVLPLALSLLNAVRVKNCNIL